MVSGTQSVQGTSPKQIELSSTVNSQELSTLICEMLENLEIHK